MNEREFRRLAEQGYTRVPVVAEARADLYTPLAVYMKLAGGPYSYLLESVVGGERFGRYSFIGLACAERIEARGPQPAVLLNPGRLFLQPAEAELTGPDAPDLFGCHKPRLL